MFLVNCMRFCHRACATIFDIPYFAEYYQYECILEKGAIPLPIFALLPRPGVIFSCKTCTAVPNHRRKKKNYDDHCTASHLDASAPHQIALDALQQFQWSVFPLDSFGEDWLPSSTILREIMAADEAENVAGSAEEKREINLSENLPSTLQMALKEKPRSFHIRLGKALDRLVDTCFGADNLRLEKKRDAHSKTNLWRIFAGSAGSVSPPTRVKILEKEKFCVQENTGRNDGNNSPHSPQIQATQNSANGLGSDLSTISTTIHASLECENTTQLPATTPEREEFDL